ncbi:esterase-like activity of phytase family protein [Tersicoccus sp. Bi-70]|uniref:esterase-like activity of phytase family protein n=1 Tax=Tersicoccus sp. Bi-70 TaxID=1897634 RepID=UPI0009FA8387|nr:esterase-like activity of phytase family protein [Tersicoccus sp. Bi-70]
MDQITPARPRRNPGGLLRRVTGGTLAAVVAASALAGVAAGPAQAAPAAKAPATADRASQDSRRPQPTGRATAPRLLARAILSADHLEPGPPSGAKATPNGPVNGRTGPFAGQVIPGFSAAVDNGDGTFWAMPDNGFGAKTNSADFLLRIYLVKPHWKKAGGGTGQVEVLRSVTLADPRHRAGFPIVNESSAGRQLTGGDFDIESLQKGANGSFWIGEEFGPFVLHVDARGRLLQAPLSFPGGGSPQNPHLGGTAPATRASGGFEGMAASPDGRFLYPVLEKSTTTAADPRARIISQIDTRTGRYTGRTWTYRVDTDDNLVGDAQMTRDGSLLILERDDFDGDAAVTKRIYRVELGKNDGTGGLAKTLVADLLRITDPAGISAGGGWGTGDTYAFSYQSVETLVPLRNGTLMLANDNNYPGNAARHPGTPDDTEMIVIDPAARVSVPAHTATVIGHRGASGYRPEHTLAAYELAIRQCADVIEPDVVTTKDGVLVDRHEPEISGTTDVASHPEFADRRTTKTVDGTKLTGWFTEDFTLAELRTLRAVERLPKVRPQNTVYNGMYRVPTLAEVLDLARHSRTCAGKQVGVAPETKHPTYFASLGLPLEDRLVAELTAAELNRPHAPVIIQSFETRNLKALNRKTPVTLSQLVDCSGGPFDLTAAGTPRSYAELITAAGLRQIARYADDVSFCKDVMIPRNADGTLGTPTAAIRDAHRAGLTVTGWTFRRENQFLPADFRRGTDPASPGDLVGEIRTFLDAGLDNVFTDNPDLGVQAVTGR